MENFEEIIKEFVEKKVVNGKVELVPLFKRRPVTINVKTRNQRSESIAKGQKVIGPDGTVYASMADAARRANIAYATLVGYCKHSSKGWKIEKNIR